MEPQALFAGDERKATVPVTTASIAAHCLWSHFPKDTEAILSGSEIFVAAFLIAQFRAAVQVCDATKLIAVL